MISRKAATGILPHRPLSPSRREAAILRSATISVANLRALGALCVGLALAGCHSTPPPTPLSQLNARQTEGYNAFQTHCAFCHNERTNEAKQGPALAGVFKKPYLPSGAPANDDRVSNTILHGHGLMPAQPNLDPDTVAALLSYLHTV